jgi:hypothetical protein
MTETPISILQKATALGLRLRIKKLGSLTVNALTVDASKPWPKDFADTLSQHKARLLDLLALPFVMVESPAIDELLLFCEDEPTKRALIDAGADAWTIYTKSELQILCAQNRVAPLSLPELAKLHEIKKTFKATIAE